MRRLLSWLVAHAAHWALLYGAFVERMEGALLVLKFFVWVLAVLSVLLLLAENAVKDSAAKPSEPVRRALNWVQGWATLVPLVWFGHIATGAAWLWVMLVVAHHQAEVRKSREAAQAA